jgi:adenylate kinase
MSRLEAYHAQTAPLVAHYDGRGTLRRVDAMRQINVVGDEIADHVARETA